MTRNNPGREKFEFILAGVGLARRKSKFSSPGQGWREKSQKGTPGKVKSVFQTRVILAVPRKRLSQEKQTPGLYGDPSIIFQLSAIRRKLNISRQHFSQKKNWVMASIIFSLKFLGPMLPHIN